MCDKTRINEKAHQLISLTTEFCEQHLDDEYEQLCEKLIRQKAKFIRDMFKMRYGNDEFLTERNKKDKPFGKSMMINGLIVPIDLLESESQEDEDEDNTMQDKRQTTLDSFI